MPRTWGRIYCSCHAATATLKSEQHTARVPVACSGDQSNHTKETMMRNHSVEGAPRIRAALYARVSTTDQTAENQLRALQEHAARAGWTILATYTDNAVSGTRERRPGLDALLADARRRKFDLIAVAALDRLGRNLRHLVTLLDELQHLGVGLVSLREALDLTSPIGRAMFALVGARRG